MDNNQSHRMLAVWKSSHLWYITGIMAACSIFYYMDAIVDFMGWTNLRWDIFFTVHDLHRLLFLIPVAYAVYIFGLKGGITTVVISTIIFLPRAFLVSPYPDPLLRVIIFSIIMGILVILFAKLLNSREDYKRAAEALKESEEGYRSLSNLEAEVGESIVLLQDIGPKEGIHVFFNENWSHITGYSSEELLDMSFFDLLSPKDRENSLKRHREKISGKNIPGFFEITVIRKDGAEVSIEITSAYTKYHGKPANIAYIRDITERKRNQDKLMESELLLKATGEMAKVGGWELDAKTLELHWSEETYQIHELPLDYKPPLEEAINYFHPDEREKLSDLLQHALKYGEAFDREMRFITAKGKQLWTRAICVPQVVDGKTVKLRGTFQDVTERRLAEASIRETHATMKTIMDRLDSLVYVVDMQTYELIYVNKYGRDLWGNIEGKICWQTIQVGQNSPCAFCTNDRLLNTDGSLAGVYVWEFKNTITDRWYLCKDQAIRWVDGRVVRMEIATDITERKQAEEHTKASLKEKEMLLKEVHHRVKNNMQVISSLLRLQAGKVRDKDVLAVLKDSQNRIQSMALVYNKLYQSQNLASINMADYIKELTAGLIKSYTTSPYRVTASIDPSDVFLGVDMAIPCGLVINEIVTNSLKYAFPENRTGQITISLKEVGNQELELVVGDNGIGIPEGIDPSNTGTLGLKLVINMVQNQLDGKIEIDRSQGTTFKITFCKAKEEK